MPRPPSWSLHLMHQLGLSPSQDWQYPSKWSPLGVHCGRAGGGGTAGAKNEQAAGQAEGHEGFCAAAQQGSRSAGGGRQSRRPLATAVSDSALAQAAELTWAQVPMPVRPQGVQ